MAIVRCAAALAGVVLAILGAGAGASAAQQIDLTGIWRDETAQGADKKFPLHVALPNDDPSPHGTYVSLPYIAIMRAKDGSLQMYSDVGAIWVALTPVAGQPEAFQMKDLTPGGNGAVLGRLNAASPDCAPRPDCFQIEPAAGIEAADFPIPNGSLVFYVPIELYDPTKDPKQSQTYGDNFAPLSANYGYLMLCYGLAGLDPTNVQDNTGCVGRNQIFAEPGLDSYSYKKTPLPDGHNVDVPFGWTYKSDDKTIGSNKTRTIDTGRELSSSDSLDIGVKASVNIFGFEAETNVSVATSQKLDTLMASKSVVATAQTVSTKYAFVLNRYYAKLNPDFVSAIRNLKNRPATDEAYQVVVNEWGTHYANAVTFGARGSRKATLDEKTIRTLREKGTNISAGMSANYAGSGGGVEAKIASDSLNNIESVLSEDDRKFICYGGGGCTEDGVPTGTDIVPIFLDLRPLSDLLAPPFFVGDEAIYGEVRRNLSMAIKDKAYKTRNDLDETTMSVVHAVNEPHLLCGDQAVTRAPGGASPLTKGYCCSPLPVASPVVAVLSFQGTSDPVVRPADRPPLNMPVDLGSGQAVNLPSDQDPAPFIAGVTVDYEFTYLRDDPAGNGVFAPNLNSYCQKFKDDGWTGSLTEESATCISGSDSVKIDLAQVCQAEYGNQSSPVWSDLENTWYCGFQMQVSVDASSWCEMQYGAGSVASYMREVNLFVPSVVWQCSLGGRFDPNAVCAAMAGHTFSSVDLDLPDQNGNLQCQGNFLGVHLAKAADATVKTYPDGGAYDPSTAKSGVPVNVVVPLDWSGDAATTCSGVNLDLVIGLQTVPPEELLDEQ